MGNSEENEANDDNGRTLARLSAQMMRGRASHNISEQCERSWLPASHNNSSRTTEMLPVVIFFFVFGQYHHETVSSHFSGPSRARN